MKNRCLNAACDCLCNDNFCCPSCLDEADVPDLDCSCKHAECALDKVPLADDEPAS